MTLFSPRWLSNVWQSSRSAKARLYAIRIPNISCGLPRVLQPLSLSLLLLFAATPKLANMFVFILLILSCTISAQNTVGSTCTGFTTNGLANSTFLYYRLYDFRNIYNTRSASTQNSITSKTVTNSSWTNDWYIRNYPRKSSGAPDIPVSFTPRRVSISISPRRNENLIYG